MRERLVLVDGTLAIESEPGLGTTLRASIPIRVLSGSQAAGAR
jgi:signal transduction histidine kinase